MPVHPFFKKYELYNNGRVFCNRRSGRKTYLRNGLSWDIGE